MVVTCAKINKFIKIRHLVALCGPKYTVLGLDFHRKSEGVSSGFGRPQVYPVRIWRARRCKNGLESSGAQVRTWNGRKGCCEETGVEVRSLIWRLRAAARSPEDPGTDVQV